MKRILNIVIFYANEEEVFTYAKNVSEQTMANDIALVIVINKQGNTQIVEFTKKLINLPLSIFIFNPNENLGYLNGALYGYSQYCKASHQNPEWVVISNTDIEFSNNKFFEDFSHTEYEDDVWCVAPSVYSPKKNSYDNPGYIDRCEKSKIDRLIYIYERPLLAYSYAKIARLKGKLIRNKKQDSQLIYSAKGCFFIIRNKLALLLQNRKYKALLYSEESYIAEIIRNHNKKTYYDSMIEVIHTENAVTGKLATKKRATYIADSLKVIRDEFYIDDGGLNDKKM